MTAKECALKYLAMGLSVIAIAPNGSKGPAKEVGSWLPYMTTARATLAQVDAWWPEGSRNGVAIVGGVLSNDLAVIDIETGDAYTQYRQDCHHEGLLYALDACPIVITPNGGRHIYCFGVHRKNLKLAKSTEGKTLIEIKGSNGYVLAPGSTEECHPTGLLYRWENNSLLELPAPALPVEKEDFNLMVTVAVIQNVGKFQEKFTPPPLAPTLLTDDRKRPGDDYNERADWETILHEAGWEISRIHGEKIYWRRPGKDEGISGTTGHCKTDGSGDLLYVFSSNAAPFQEGKAYSKFSAITLLKYQGSFYAATRALGLEGFGEPEVEANFLHKPSVPPLTIWTPDVANLPIGREYKFVKDIKAQNPDKTWHWHGYLYPGCLTLLSALWKVGKTTLISGLLKSWEQEQFYLGQKVSQARALYCSEEGDATWESRCLKYGLRQENHGFFLQPFITMPTIQQWQDFLGKATHIMARDGFDVLIVDTMAQMWPVKDENSAAEVGAAVNALKAVCRDGKRSVLAVHHMRKSGGEHFTGARGSGAASALADILIDFTREDSAGFGQRSKTKRVLTGTGRWNEYTPAEMVIDFIDDELVCLGQKDDLEFQARIVSILEVLNDFEYLTLEQVQTASGQRRDTVIRQLEDLVESGKVETTGTGTRGSKKKFRKVTVQQPHQNNLGDFNNGDGQSL